MITDNIKEQIDQMFRAVSEIEDGVKQNITPTKLLLMYRSLEAARQKIQIIKLILPKPPKTKKVFNHLYGEVD